MFSKGGSGDEQSSYQHGKGAPSCEAARGGAHDKMATSRIDDPTRGQPPVSVGLRRALVRGLFGENEIRIPDGAHLGDVEPCNFGLLAHADRRDEVADLEP